MYIWYRISTRWILLPFYALVFIHSAASINIYELQKYSMSSVWPALQRKSHLCIPRKGIAPPQSQFPHSCVCERFIYSQDRSTYFPAAGQADWGPAIPFLRIFEFTVLCLRSVSFFVTSVKLHRADSFHDISVILVGLTFVALCLLGIHTMKRKKPFYGQFIRKRQVNY